MAMFKEESEGQDQQLEPFDTRLSRLEMQSMGIPWGDPPAVEDAAILPTSMS